MLLQYFQYALYFVGFLMIFYGFLTARINRNLQEENTFWVKIDNARTYREVHEYAMYESSNAIKGLVNLSALILAIALIFSIAFPDILSSNLDKIPSQNLLQRAIFGAQILTALSLTFFALFAMYGYLQDNLSPSTSTILSGLFGIYTVSAFIFVIYTAFEYIVPSILALNELVEPVFLQRVDSFSTQVIIPFFTTTLLLAYPFLLLIAIIFMTVETLDSLGIIKNWNLNKYKNKPLSIGLIFIVGFIGSIFYTLMSGTIGTSFDNVVEYKVSFQLVISNAVFDGVTLFATVALLKWASASWRCRVTLSKFEKMLKFTGEQRPVYSSMREYKAFASKLRSKPIFAENVFQSRHEWNYSEKHIEKLIKYFNELAEIYGFKDLVLFDRILYRKIIENDLDVNFQIPLTNKVKYSTFNPEHSWLLYVLSELQDDAKIIFKENDKLKAFDEHGWKNEGLFSHSAFKRLDVVMKDLWENINTSREIFSHRPIIAILFDVLIATACSFMSIVFGFLSSGNELRLPELLDLFIGGFDGSQFSNIGPLFWIMHTTFIPSIFLWLLLILLMLSAFVISPLMNWIGEIIISKKQSNDIHPELAAQFSISKSGSLIMAFATILGLLNYFLK